MMEVIEQLKSIRNLLSNPAHWTKGAFAKTADGKPIGANENNAVCWCIRGAIHKVIGHGCYAVPHALEYALGDEMLAEWNDAESRTHADVIALIDKAIANTAKPGAELG